MKRERFISRKVMAELFGVSFDYLVNGKEDNKQDMTEINHRIRKLFITAVIFIIGISFFC